METQKPDVDVEKVIARIRKLLARKTEGGASEAEADTAMRLAQDLMSKHNLDMASIESADVSKVDTTRTKEEMKGRTRYQWQRRLAKHVAESHFCYYLLHETREWIPPHWSDEEPTPQRYAYEDSRDGGMWNRFSPEDKPDNLTWVEGRYAKALKHIFVGRKVNVITAQLMYHYLCDTIDAEVLKQGYANHLSNAAASWKEGISRRPTP
jgi:hypothetical protein